MKKLFAIITLAAASAMAANEITLNWSFTASKGGLYVTRQMTRQLSITSATPNVSSYTIAVSTSAAGVAILPGYVLTNGWGYVINTATGTPTNITSGVYAVDIGVNVGGTFYPSFRLLPTEGHPIRFSPGVTNYARSISGTNIPVVLECPIIDN